MTRVSGVRLDSTTRVVGVRVCCKASQRVDSTRNAQLERASDAFVSHPEYRAANVSRVLQAQDHGESVMQEHVRIAGGEEVNVCSSG